MSEPESGGGFTGNADGAPYTGYDPGPAAQSPTDVPANPSGLSPEELHRLQESDKPIEYDPIGQALVSLPVSLAQGLVSAAAAGASMGAELLKEGVAWGASELGLNAAEQVVEGSEGSDQHGADAAADPGDFDGGVPEQDAGVE
jgi:hypothetical protein